MARALLGQEYTLVLTFCRLVQFCDGDEQQRHIPRLRRQVPEPPRTELFRAYFTRFQTKWAIPVPVEAFEIVVKRNSSPETV